MFQTCFSMKLLEYISSHNLSFSVRRWLLDSFNFCLPYFMAASVMIFIVNWNFKLLNWYNILLCYYRLCCCYLLFVVISFFMVLLFVLLQACNYYHYYYLFITIIIYSFISLIILIRSSIYLFCGLDISKAQPFTSHRSSPHIRFTIFYIE